MSDEARSVMLMRCNAPLASFFADLRPLRVPDWARPRLSNHMSVTQITAMAGHDRPDDHDLRRT